MVCRHFAAMMIEHRLTEKEAHINNKSFEILQTLLSDETYLDRLVESGDYLEGNYRDLNWFAPERHLMHTNDFGMVCRRFLTRMTFDGQTEKNFIVSTARHAMTLQLKIKEDLYTGKQYYVASLYDPNKTNYITKFKCDSVNDFDDITLTQLCGRGLGPQDQYYIDRYFGTEAHNTNYAVNLIPVSDDWQGDNAQKDTGTLILHYHAQGHMVHTEPVLRSNWLANKDAPVKPLVPPKQRDIERARQFASSRSNSPEPLHAPIFEDLEIDLPDFPPTPPINEITP
jgi:hypothetical protein